MRKLLLLSILIAIIVLPVFAARERNGALAFKKTLLVLLIFNFFYMLALLFVYQHVQ